jgi:uncharacterized protein with HEPN domain
MTEEAKKYLSDILLAIKNIEDFTSEISSFEHYQKDIKTQSAVERQLGIIGEAINHFEKLLPDEKLEHARQISGLRNRIIHAYDAIDNTIIWAILKNHIPPLKTDVEKKIKD